MEENSELYSKIQSLLLTKDSEINGLKYVSVKDSKETSKFVEEICERIKDLVKYFKIPQENKESSGSNVNLFKFLVLNTNFRCQDQLSEDISCSHLIGFCPTMSQYLLLEILHSLNFELIISKSLIHFPLDLTVEMIEGIRKNISIFESDQDDLILNSSVSLLKKVIHMREKETQSLNLEENLEKLVIFFGGLIGSWVDKEPIGKEMEKSEEIGLRLKKVLNLIEMSLELNGKRLMISEDADKLYELTFGRDHFVKLDWETGEEFFHRFINSIFSCAIQLLQQVDVNTFLNWASLESAGDQSVTLQQSIGFDAHRVLVRLKDEKLKELSSFEEIEQILKQFARKPVVMKDLKLEELLKKVEKGEAKALKELMSRYESWNHLAFDHVEKNQDLLDKEDFLVLLKYLTNLISKPGQELHKQKVYQLITKVLLRIDIRDSYEVTLKYILNVNGESLLETAETEETFKNFLVHNSDLRDSSALKVVLFFLLKNPMKYLKLLVKISVGIENSLKNVMIPPKDLIVLSAIMNVRMENKSKMILNILKSVGMEMSSFKVNFTNFIMVIINAGVVTPTEVIKDVLINLIEADELPMTSVKTVLNCLRQIISSKLSPEIYDNLFFALAKRLLLLRTSWSTSKQTICENLVLITSILNVLMNNCVNVISKDERRKIVSRVEKVIHPIDEFYFHQLLDQDDEVRKLIDIKEIIRNSSKRINDRFLKLGKMKKDSKFVEEKLSKEILRNLMICSTQNEFTKVGLAVSLFSWRDLDLVSVDNDDEALENFLNIILETLCYFFRFSDKILGNSFGCLLKFLAEFLKTVSALENVWDLRKLTGFVKNLFQKMGKFIRGTEFEDIYSKTLIQVNNYPICEQPIYALLEHIELLDSFADESLNVTNFYCLDDDECLKTHLSQKLINHCLHLSGNEDYISELFDQFFH